MNRPSLRAERALMIVAGLFVAEAIVPAVLTAVSGDATRSAWAAFGVVRLALAVGLVRRWRLASLLAQGLLGFELLMYLLMAVGMLVIRGGTVYAGLRGTWLYSQSPALVLPVMVVLGSLTYWQWNALGRFDVGALFRRPRDA